MFTRTYELSLNKGYVAHWGLAEAVRELIQNALDSESPFVYEFKNDGDEHTLKLRSEFTTLSPQTLLLGSTSKADSEDSIGSFGEGYKIALLVLTRLFKPVSIANGDKLWEPRFKYNSKFEQELLVVEESTLAYKNTGLTFEIRGLTSDECDDIRDSCLRMQSDIGAIKQTPYGDILLERPGKLYVGGLFICSTELIHGYNIKPSNIKLERDRQTVSSWELSATTTNMWYATEEYETIANMINEGVPDVADAQWSSPALVKEACYRLFREQHPGAIIAENQTHLKELVAKGMEKVVFIGGSMYANVSSSRAYRSETRVAVESINDRLVRWLGANRGKMQAAAIVAFKELISESKGWHK